MTFLDADTERAAQVSVCPACLNRKTLCGSRTSIKRPAFLLQSRTSPAVHTRAGLAPLLRQRPCRPVRAGQRVRVCVCARPWVRALSPAVDCCEANVFREE